MMFNKAKTISFGLLTLVSISACGVSSSEWLSESINSEISSEIPSEVTSEELTIPLDYEFDDEVANTRGGAYYEIFVRSFADSDGDSIGDLLGVASKMEYLNQLGVGGVWLMPIHPSPSYHGYDVDDYKQINEDYGTLADFDQMIEAANNKDIDVIIDLVLNHSSNTHPWFTEGFNNFKNGNFSVDDNSNKANWYNFYWDSGQVKYEAGFGEWMPDLNLDNPLVREEIASIAKFWLDRGVAGFRLDAVTYFYTNDTQASIDFLAWFKDVVKQENEDAFIVGEAWREENTVGLYYRGIDSLFNFQAANTGGYIIDNITSRTGSNFAFLLANTNNKMQEINDDARVATFLTNHDMDRSAQMYVMYIPERQKLAASTYLLSPGIPFMYYGEEIGLKGTRGSAMTDANRRLPMIWQRGTDPWRTDVPPGTTYPMENQVREGAFDLLEEAFSLTNHYKKVLNVRNSYPWLIDARVDFVNVANNLVGALKMESKDGLESPITVLHNFDGNSVTLDLSRINNQQELFIAHDIFTSQTRTQINEETITLAPFSSVVLEER